MKLLIKESLLALVGAAGGILAFATLERAVQLIATGLLQDYSAFLLPAGALLFAACFFSLVSLFVVSLWVMGAAILLPFAAAPLLMSLAAPSVGACIASGLLALYAGWRMRREHQFSITFSTSKMLKAGLPIYFTTVSIVVSLFYYQQITDQEHAVTGVIPRAAVELSLRFLSGAVSDLEGAPKADSALTVDEFLAQNLEGQLKSQGVAMKKLPKQEVAELVAEQRNELAKRYGIQIKGGERLADVLHRTITEKVQELLGPYARFLPFLSALAFFFAFRTLTFFLYFVVVLVTALLIALARAATIIKSEKRQIEVEHLTL